MIEFFNRLFGRQSSGATAKERLRLVLMSDHLSLAPEMVDAMKADLIEVISRYVEVDRDRIDVHFENQHNVLAMLANIPITGVSRGSANGTNGHAEQPQPEHVDGRVEASPSLHGHAEQCQPEHVDGRVEAQPSSHGHAEQCHPEHVEGFVEASPSLHGHAEHVEARPSAVEAKGKPPSRKRRKRSGNGTQTASSTPARAN